jgi:hypothetical protein
MTETLQKQLYGIGIFEEEIVLSDFTGAAEKRFVVSPEQLMAFVSTDVTFRPFPGLIWMQKNQQVDTYLLLLSAGKRTILYRKGKKLVDYPVTLPPIAVRAQISASEHKITKIDMWGMAGKQLTEATMLYELPLPNLTGSNLCLGSTGIIAGDDIPAAVQTAIFDTPFNHHNYLVGKKAIPFHDYVKKYRGSCPLRTLKPIEAAAKLLRGLK